MINIKTILVITSSIDKTVDYLVYNFKERVNFFRIDTDKLTNYKFEVRTTSLRITSSVGVIEDNSIDAVYYRKPMMPDMSLYNYKFHSLMQRDILTLIEGIAEIVGKRSLTRPSILKRAENKVTQLHIASKLDFYFQLHLSLMTVFVHLILLKMKYQL